MPTHKSQGNTLQIIHFEVAKNALKITNLEFYRGVDPSFSVYITVIRI